MYANEGQPIPQLLWNHASLTFVLTEPYTSRRTMNKAPQPLCDPKGVKVSIKGINGPSWSVVGGQHLRTSYKARNH